MIAERIGIDAARPHAAASALAADNQAIHTQLREMRNERRAEEAAGALFENNHVARFRFEFFLDLECLRIDLHALAIRRVHRARFCFLASFGRGVKHGELKRAGQGEKLLGWLNSFVRINTAGAFVSIDQFMRRRIFFLRRCRCFCRECLFSLP